METKLKEVEGPLSTKEKEALLKSIVIDDLIDNPNLVYLDLDKRKKTECVVCFQVPVHPTQFHCGHRVCTHCYDGMKKTNNTVFCPICNKKVESAFADNAFKREKIYQLRVACLNSSCTWTGCLTDLKHHLDGSSFQLSSCAEELLNCPDCLLECRRGEVIPHLRQHCPKRLVNCQYCHEVYVHELEKDHFPVCREFPRNCQYCGASFPSKKIQNHEANECEETPLPCFFHLAGCQVPLVRKEMEAHIADNVVIHQKLMYLLFLGRGQENRNLNGASQEAERLLTVMDSNGSTVKEVSTLLDVTSGAL